MAQATRTSCAHNAPGQTLVAGRPVPCRQCGAQLQPSPRAIDATTGLFQPGENGVNAAYPQDKQAWAFVQ